MIGVVQPFLRFRLFASARVKLVASFVAVLALVLLIFSATLVWTVHRSLFAALNERLVTHGQQMAELIELREGQLLFAKLDELNVENEALRTLSVRMFDASGEPLWQASRNQLPVSPLLQETLSSGDEQLTDFVLPFERYRVLTKPVTRDGTLIGILQVGLSVRDIDEAVTKILVGLLLTVPGALIGAAVGGWFLAARALKPIEESVRRQRQFIQDASHELRTPLAIIQSNIDVALQNPDPSVEQLQDKLNTVNETAKRMGKIITDLFTLSTSDTQTLRLKTRLVDLDKVGKDVVRQMRSLARKKEQTLSVGDAEQLVVFGDEDRLKQVVTILVDNAIKYTQAKGTITVSVTKTPAIDVAKLSVSDNGPGISKENQLRIFERFYRVDKSRSRELGGNGLGLAIAKMIVEKSRGYLSVQSKPGKGTRFDVYLPLVSKKSAAFSLPKLFSLSTVRPNEKSKDETVSVSVTTENKDKL
jgi:signal transduction histidine kinase